LRGRSFKIGSLQSKKEILTGFLKSNESPTKMAKKRKPKPKEEKKEEEKKEEKEED